MQVGVIAVDVGSRQVRGGLFDLDGTLLASSRTDIGLGQHSEVMATYRMQEIWQAAQSVVRDCAGQAAKLHVAVEGLAFDATSSLFADGHATPFGEGQGDVIGWMDHRAQDEALEISETRHGYLDYFSGAISPEIHLPKMLWTSRQRPGLFDEGISFRDVCDELALRATGADVRSASALVCKWPYMPNEALPWRTDLLDSLGMPPDWCKTLPNLPVRPLGARHGTVSAEAAQLLGLAEGTVVAVGAIDAEAGVLGNVGPDLHAILDHTLLVTGGTSTNFMTFCAEERSIPGVWGPFLGAVFPGYWMHEGGQSLSGGALDAVLRQHAASPGEPSAETHKRVVNDILDLLSAEPETFAAQKHLVPDWLGNRAPLNDGRVRAIMSGIGQELDYRSLLETYYATARGLVLQMRQVIEHLNAHGYAIDTVHLSGGHRHNELLVRLYADCFDGELLVTDVPEPVLLGSAMIAATAAGHIPSLFEAAKRMARKPVRVARDPKGVSRLRCDYEIYLKLHEAQKYVCRDWLADV